MKTIGRQFADYSLGLDYRDLPQEVVRHAKRVLLDTLGCAIGGYASQASTILRGLMPELKGPKESTIIGDGTKTSCLYATLANGAMVRFLDYNDTYFSPGPVLAGAHSSDIIPSILAVAEWQGATGEQVIAAIVAGYELTARFTDGCTIGKTLEQRGWNTDLRAGLIVPPVVGKLLGLNAEQIENAIGIAGSHSMLLGILDASKEEYTMTKNLRFPFGAHAGIMAAMLAHRGFTGPVRVVEGQRGVVESVLSGEFDFGKATDFRGFKIMETAFKPFTSDVTTHGHLAATLHLVKEHSIRPEDVARIRVWATSRDVEHTGQPAKRYPKNKETADHSSYYLTAIAIVDGRIGPDQFSPEKFEDPRVRTLIDKMTFQVDPDLDRFVAAGISEITTRQGATYRHRFDYPKGFPQNPMTDAEIEDKFRSMARKLMDEAQTDKLMKAIYRLEQLDDIVRLMRLLKFKPIT